MKFKFVLLFLIFSIKSFSQDTLAVRVTLGYKFKEGSYYAIGINGYIDSLPKPGLMRIITR